MRFWHKFVSAGLFAAVLSLPLMSLAMTVGMCAPESNDSMHCPPGCPMMAKMKSGQQAELKAEPTAGSCCTLTRGKSSPVPKSSMVQPAVSVEPVAVIVDSVAPAASHALALTDTSPPLLADRQSRLCTFQI